MKRIVFALLTAATFITACENDDDKKPEAPSRTLRFELTSNFSGNIVTATFTDEYGGTITEEITSFPWTREINFEPTVGGANMVVSGANGVAGQQVTMTIKKNGTQFGTPITAIADSGGTFTLTSPVIIF